MSPAKAPQGRGRLWLISTWLCFVVVCALLIAAAATTAGFPIYPDSFSATAQAAAAGRANAADVMCSDQKYQPGMVFTMYDKQTQKWGLVGQPCNGAAPTNNVVSGYCAGPDDCRATEINGKQIPGLPSGAQGQDLNSPAGAAAGDQGPSYLQQPAAQPTLSPDSAPCAPGECTQAPPSQASSPPANSSLSGLPYSTNPVFNETTGQFESQPLQDMDDQSLYPTTVLNGPSQAGTVFNETTGQWEGAAAPQQNYSMPVLPDNPTNELLQAPGTVPTYTEGDQNYQYAPETNTFNPSNSAASGNVAAQSPAQNLVSDITGVYASIGNALLQFYPFQALYSLLHQ